MATIIDGGAPHFTPAGEDRMAALIEDAPELAAQLADEEMAERLEWAEHAGMPLLGSVFGTAN
jgi:hypothetical protein